MFKGCAFGFPEGFGVPFQIEESHLIPKRLQISSGEILSETTVKCAADLSITGIEVALMVPHIRLHRLESQFRQII